MFGDDPCHVKDQRAYEEKEKRDHAQRLLEQEQERKRRGIAGRLFKRATKKAAPVLSKDQAAIKIQNQVRRLAALRRWKMKLDSMYDTVFDPETGMCTITI